MPAACSLLASALQLACGAGLNSKQLFKGHKLQAIGDTPREKPGGHDADNDGIFDHLRDEEADIVRARRRVTQDCRPRLWFSETNPDFSEWTDVRKIDLLLLMGLRSDL